MTKEAKKCSEIIQEIMSWPGETSLISLWVDRLLFFVKHGRFMDEL